MKDQTMKKDLGKPRWDLLPLIAIESMVNVLTFGAQKYADDGWKKLMITKEGEKRVIASLRRHQVAIELHGISALDLNADGGVDEDHSGLPHLGHLQCNVMFLEWRRLWLAKKEECFAKDLSSFDGKNVYTGYDQGGG